MIKTTSATDIRKILIVDDSKVQLHALEEFLRQEGYLVRTASDGVDALYKLMSSSPDLIISDVQMPKMSGLEATIKIREQTKQHEKPWIIALTAGVMEEERLAAKKAGMNAFLAKPLVIEQLEEMLEHALGAPSQSSSSAKF